MATNPQQFDPNVDYDAKQAQTKMTSQAPSWYERMIGEGANALRSAQPQGYIPGGGAGGTGTPTTAYPATAEGRIAQQTAYSTQEPRGARTATNSSVGSAPNVNDPSNATMGSGAALTPGLRRYSGMPGVYSGRSRDGSLYFTDDPNSAFTKSTVDPNGLRRSDINVGTYANDRGPNTGAYGYGADLPARTGTDQMAGDRLYAAMTGQGDPNAGRALAPNTLQSGVNGRQFDTSAKGLDGMSYSDLQNAMNAVNGAPTGNREQDMANQALRGRLQARIENLRQGDAPGAFPVSPYGIGTGAYGMGGMPPGSNPLDFMKFAADQQNNAANRQIEGYRAETQRASQQNADLRDLEKQIGDAQDPTQRAGLLFSRVPNDPATMQRWLRTPEGQYVSGQLNDTIAQGTGGPYRGGGLRSLRFNRGDSNNFTIGRPNTMFPDENARTWYGSNRFGDPFYTADNIEKLRSLRDIMNPQGEQDDE